MAAIATQTIELDLTPGGVSPFLYVSQGDYGTRNLVFNLMMNGQPYSIPNTVTTVSLEGITKGGNMFNVTCTFSGSTATASLTADMTADIGMDICQIVLKNGSGERLGTANFFIVVELSPGGVKLLYGNVYWSDLAKSWAVGGTDLRSDEETNNSRYWSEISEQFANSMRPELDLIKNDITVLESLINQYVTPSTQYPDEVVNARVGFDGTTYTNLGAAVRSQVTVYGYIPGSEEIYFRRNTL